MSLKRSGSEIYESDMSRSKTAFAGVFWTLANNFVGIVYGFISVPLLLSYFGKEQYGLIGMAASLNVYLQLLDMGMTNTYIKFFSESIAKNDNLGAQKLFSLTNSIYIFVGFLNSLILFILAFFTGSIFSVTPEQAVTLRHLVMILALNSIFSWASVCLDQFIRANDLVGWIKKRSTFLKLVQAFFLATTIIFKMSIEFYYLATLFSLTIILPLSYIKIRKIAPYIRFKPKFDKQLFLKILPYGLSVFSFGIFQFLALNSRPFLLGNMAGPGTVAEYSILSAVTSAVTMVSGVFMPVLLPMITKMAVGNENNEIERVLRMGTKYVNILLSLIAFTLVIASREILEVYVGKDYLNLAVWLNIWLLTLILNFRSVLASLVFTKSKLWDVAIMCFIAMTVAFICYFVFIPKYGVGGVVIGFLLHELIHTLFLLLYYMPRKCNINTWRLFKDSLAPTWLLELMVIGIVFLSFNYIYIESVFLTGLIKGLLFFFIMLPLVWFVIFNNADKSFVRHIIQRKADK